MGGVEIGETEKKTVHQATQIYLCTPQPNLERKN